MTTENEKAPPGEQRGERETKQPSQVVNIVLTPLCFSSEQVCQGCGRRFAQVGPIGFLWRTWDDSDFAICRECAGHFGYVSLVLGGIE